MAIFLENSYILLNNGASSSTLWCSSIEQLVDSTLFDRPEFKHQRLAQALETDGTAVLKGQTVTGLPYQIIYGTDITPRNFAPDDADLTNIKQKFLINRYIFKGNTSLNSDVTQALAWAKSHHVFKDYYEAYQQLATSDNVSIDLLVNSLQAIQFAYLTSTTVSVVSKALGTLSNIVIRDFQVSLDADYSTTADDTGARRLLNSWTGTFEQISVATAYVIAD